MPFLVFLKNGQQHFQVQLKGSATKIGRSNQCDIVLSDPEISREHAGVYSSEEQFLLKKLGQGNLRLGEVDLEQHPLQEGDLFSLGNWEVKFEKGQAEIADDEATLVTQGSGEKTHAIAAGSKGLLLEELRLNIVGKEDGGQSINLNPGTHTLGADPKNDIVLEDPFISSNHLKLIYSEGRVQIVDLQSTNGTRLGGIKIQEADWEAGQELKVGNYFIHLEDSSKVVPVQPLETDRFGGMVGGTAVMKKLYGQLQAMAPTEATVLILGESGTGKELVANSIHQLSERGRGPFVAINCGAISKELIESELFGHEKGAFTGAANRHEGAFGQAKGGTLFLDEIGELPLELQPKLLRVLENKTYRRVGGTEEMTADVRIVAATHQDLASLVEGGGFRQDLFFRLFVLPISIPSLRERLEDLPLLIESFIEEFCPPGQKKVLGDQALKKLNNHSFPGNIRELRNILLRAVLMASNKTLQAGDILFPEGLAPNRSKGFLGVEKLEDLERKMVEKALQAHDGNKAKAADALGIAKSTLFSKIKLYGLDKAKA